MAGKQPHSRKDSGTPSSMPEGTPSLASPTDHSFTLQAIMEMKGTLGELAAKIDRMRDDVGELSKKIETNCDNVAAINTTLARWATGAAVVVTIVLMLWAIAQIIPWDRISIQPPQQSSAVQAPPSNQTLSLS
jgi:hypothetical protein